MIIDRLQIEAEESALLEKFGAAYEAPSRSIATLARPQVSRLREAVTSRCERATAGLPEGAVSAIAAVARANPRGDPVAGRSPFQPRLGIVLLLESGAAPMPESSASRGTNGPSSGGAP